MNMFCANCGSQIPDDARFCSHCGKVVAPAEPVQQHTAPYTVPVGQGDAYREQMRQAQQQQPSQTPYTVPLGYEGQYTPPQQYPQHTVPVDNPPQFPQSAQQIPSFAPPVQPPVQSAPQVPAYTPPKHPTTPKKTRKLPILLGAIAVVLIIVLVAVFSGGKNESGRARIRNGKFTFTTNQMEEWFAADLKENSIPLNWTGSTTYYTLKHGSEKVGLFYLYHDPEGSHVTSVSFELNRTHAYAPWFDTAVKCLAKQCHGAMTDEMLETFLNSRVITQELSRNGSGESYEVATCIGYGLKLEIWELEESTAVTIRPADGDPFEAPTVTNVANVPPSSTEAAYKTAPRYVKWHFKFDEKQFL